MLWLFVALLSRAFYALCNIFDSHFCRGIYHYSYTQNIAAGFFCLVTALAACCFHTPAWPAAELWPWLLVAAALQGFYLIPYFAAMTRADVSMIVSLFTLGRALTPLLAHYIVQETLGIEGYIGFAVVIVGALYHSYVPHARRIAFRPALLMLLSGLMAAGYMVTSKHVFNHIPFMDGFILINLFSGIMVGLSFLCAPKRTAYWQDLKNALAHYKPIFLNYLAWLAATFLLFYSIDLTSPTYVAMVGQFQPLFVLIFMYLLRSLHWIQAQETFTPDAIRQKITGFLIMAAGMAITLFGAHALL